MAKPKPDAFQMVASGDLETFSFPVSPATYPIDSAPAVDKQLVNLWQFGNNIYSAFTDGSVYVASINDPSKFTPCAFEEPTNG